MNWYQFKPADTLLFKGAEPMNMGEHHQASSIFPPPTSTLIGALRTAVLIQNEISFTDFHHHKEPEMITKAIGSANQDAPFSITGPLFCYQNEFFIPAPFNWYTKEKKEDKQKEDEKKNVNMKILKSKPLSTPLIQGSSEQLYWVDQASDQLKTVGGRWMNITLLNQDKAFIIADLKKCTQEQLRSAIIDTNLFYTTESRTGIKLKKNREVEEGHIYEFHHIRLIPEVSILFGVDQTLPINPTGALTLGAERRFGHYQKIQLPDFQSSGKNFLALNSVLGTPEANDAVVATGKIKYLGGWDLKKGFHKPMKGYFPAGTVFNQKLDHTMIPI